MNSIFDIQSGESSEAGFIAIHLFSLITLLIGGVISSGEHLHLGLRIWNYEISFQLHNHKEQSKENNKETEKGELK